MVFHCFFTSWIFSASLLNWSLKKDFTIVTCCFGFDAWPCVPSISNFLLLSCLLIYFIARNIFLESSLIFSINSSWAFSFSVSFCCSSVLIVFWIVFLSFFSMFRDFSSDVDSISFQSFFCFEDSSSISLMFSLPLLSGLGMVISAASWQD